MVVAPGNMGLRLGLFLLFVFSAGWACDARQLSAYELSDKTILISGADLQINNQEKGSEFQVSNDLSKNDQVCTLCEQYATQALDYLSENKTQTDIIDILHKTCSRVPTFKQECTTLVDYYVPLFFLEVSSIQAGDLCRRVNLCEQMSILSSKFQEDSCGLCHHAVSEVLDKLKDPDTQLEIIEALLKACSAMDNYAKKCKKLVFEYAPIILANTEQFLETKDICTILHACNSSTTTDDRVSLVADS